MAEIDFSFYFLNFFREVRYRYDIINFETYILLNHTVMSQPETEIEY